MKKQTILNIQTFFDNQFTDFSSYAAYRSLASYSDGLKNSKRKVVYTTQKYIKGQKEKVSRLAATVSLKSEYLHGETSLEGAIVTLVRNWDQNICLYDEIGKFGTRTIPHAASSRYIFTKKSNIFDQIFLPDFYQIDEPQLFEGTKIEPKSLTPILPLILINGETGVGSGFSQNILPRNPKQIQDTIIKYIKSKAKKPEHIINNSVLDIQYPNFTNGIIKTILTDSNKLKTFFLGNVKKKNTTTLIIDQLPIGYTIENYIKILETLIEKKTIVSYKDSSSKNNFNFEIKIKREILNSNLFSFDINTKTNLPYIIETLKLVSSSVENFTTTGPNNSFHKFNTPQELLLKYLDFILERYEKLRLFKIQVLENEIILLSEKSRFIKLVIENKLKISNISKKNISTNMKKLKFSEDIIELCLSMKIYSLTKEKYEELLNKIVEITQDKSILEEKTNKDLYLIDINKINIL